MNTRPIQTFIPLMLIAISAIAGLIFNVYPKGHWQLIPVVIVGIVFTCLFQRNGWLPRVFLTLPLSGIILSGSAVTINNWVFSWKILTCAMALIILSLCQKNIKLSASQLNVLCIGLLPGLLCVAVGGLFAHLYYNVGLQDLLQLLLSLSQALLLMLAVYVLTDKKQTSLSLAVLTVVCILMAGRS